MEKEIERVGIPAVQISTMTPVAAMVGSNRIIPGAGIVHPVGNPDLEPEQELALRHELLQKALKALATRIEESTVFDS